MNTTRRLIFTGSLLLAFAGENALAENDPPLRPAKMTETALLARARQITQEELELSRIALRKAEAEKVKAFARRAAERAGELDRKLSALAAAAGVTEPEKISPPMQERLAAIEKLTGEMFDPDYLKMLLDFHRAHILIYEELAKRAADAKLRDFAREALITERAHLKTIETLAAPLIPDVN
jgi:predicted outer membrane protein